MDKQPELAAVLKKYNVFSVNGRRDDGWTALMRAVVMSDKAAVALLVEHGADLELKDRDQRTALFLAVEFKQKYMMAFLLEQGADLNTRKNNGMTPLAFARDREKAYKGTETGARYAELIKLMELWPRVKNRRLRALHKTASQKKEIAPPPPPPPTQQPTCPSKRAGPGRRWQI